MNRNFNIISHIIEHIENIFRTQERFGNGFHIFNSDKDYFNSVCMNLLQIGELANHLTLEFKSEYTDIPWKNIVGLRNVVVHGYGQLDTEIVWATVTDDIPDLFQKCELIKKSFLNEA